MMNIHEKRDLNVLRLLKGIAEDSDPVANSRHAAGLVYKNDIISVGVNMRKTHPIQALFGKNDESIFLHAELNAIIRAAKVLTEEQISRSTLFVVRAKADKSFGLSKPCKGCASCIAKYNISRFVYSTNKSTLDDINSFEEVSL